MGVAPPASSPLEIGLAFIVSFIPFTSATSKPKRRPALHTYRTSYFRRADEATLVLYYFPSLVPTSA